MAHFDTTKAEFNTALERLLALRSHDPRRILLEDWVHTLSSTEITTLDFSFDPRALSDHYSDDEIVFSKTFSFYDVMTRPICENAVCPVQIALRASSAFRLAESMVLMNSSTFATISGKAWRPYIMIPCFSQTIWML
jgi:hypothetical protein